MPRVVYCYSVVGVCLVGFNLLCAFVVLAIETSALYDDCMRMWLMLLFTFTLICGQIYCYVCFSSSITCIGTRRSVRRLSICVLYFVIKLILLCVLAREVFVDYTCNEKNHVFMAGFFRFQLITIACFLCIWASYIINEFTHLSVGVNVDNIETMSECDDQSIGMPCMIVCPYMPTVGEMCCICHDLYVKPVTLVCKHPYCSACIMEWATKNNTCPVCRQQIISCDELR
jgi:hypothetical protein